MLGDDLLNEGVRVLLKKAMDLLKATGLGVVRVHGDDDVILTYADPFGATAYRTSAEMPPAFRPRATGLLAVPAAELEANPSGLIESRILLTSFSEQIRRVWAPRRVFTLPVPDGDGSTLLVVAVSDLTHPDQESSTALESLARSVT